MQALRQILVQNFLVDARGLLRPRTEKDGQPKGARRIVSPYDCQTRRAIRGNTRWSGYLVHVTETCDTGENANLITDIATTSPTRDAQALPGIHTRLRRRRLLPREHLVDGGYLSVALLESSAVHHQIQLIGPVKASGAWQKKEQTGFTGDDFTIDFDRRRVTCPNGQIAKTWIALPAMAPYTVARFYPHQCTPCPDRSACTRGTSARTVNIHPRHLHELQIRNRTEQQDLQRGQLYATRSGVEGTICEFVNGHQARRSRYHGLRKTHVQHVLERGAVALHHMDAPVVHVRGDRAYAEASTAMRFQVEVDGVQGDLISRTRLNYRLAKREDVWRILSLDAVYEYCTLTPSVPGQSIVVPPEELAGYRPSYAVLAWNIAREGRTPSADELGEDRPGELAAFYASIWEWLTAGPA
ncbi:transposase [Streptomyces sp. NPDC003832]